MANQTEVISLVAQISAAAHHYYNAAHESSDKGIADAEYDALVDRLRSLDPGNAILETVGAPVTRAKTRHKMPMMSLNKITTADELLSFVMSAGSIGFCVQPKMDGCALELQYVDGVLVTAVTRGDGLVGEDVTANVKRMKSVPHVIKPRITCSVRGESLLSVANWEIEDPSKSKNPRNAGNGMLRRTSGENCHLLEFQAYDIFIEDEEMKPISESVKVQVLQEMKFITVLNYGCLTDGSWGTSAIEAAIADIKKSRDAGRFHIDGCVIKVNSVAVYDRMGVSGNRPKGHVAFKWGSEVGITKITSVALTVGHTGAIVPTAALEPIELLGTTVSNVLLNNYDEIARLDVAIGDTVEITKRGEIIPKVEKVIHRPDDRVQIDPPAKCPVCGAATRRVLLSDEKTFGAALVCSGISCPAKAVGKLKRWVTSLNILGIGDGLLETLARSPAELYRLTVDELAGLEMGVGVVGNSRAESIIAEIQKTRTLTIDQFIGSLGVSYLGKRKVQLIRELAGGKMDSLESWLDGTILTVSKQCQIDGIAPRINGELRELQHLIKLLSGHITVTEPVDTKIIGQKGPNFGTEKVFVLTGKFSVPKAEIHAQITAAGHKFSDELRKGEATHLVQADKSSESAKTRKAASWGVPTIDLNELHQLLTNA